jgi:hypothetical protein
MGWGLHRRASIPCRRTPESAPGPREREAWEKVRIDKTFPLADVAEAHQYLEGRRSKGKILLIP